jgi:hypothetical protein
MARSRSEEVAAPALAAAVEDQERLAEKVVVERD